MRITRPAKRPASSQVRHSDVTVHIERVVLEGLPVTPGQRAAMQSALEAELTRLFAEDDVEGLKGTTNSRITAAALHISPETKPGALGCQIARVVHESITDISNPHRELRQEPGRHI